MARERHAKTLAELAAGARAPAATEAHLADCAACRAELAALREALALADATLGALFAEEPRPELPVRIRQAAAAARGPRGAPLPRSWTWVAAVAAGALVAVLWYATGTVRESPSSSASVAPPAAVPAPRAAALMQDAQLRGHARLPGPSATAAHVTEVARAQHVVRSSPPPLVLVPAGEREALLRFADQLQERTVAPDSLLVADPLRELPPVEPVRIEPLEIAPLAGAGKS